MDSGKRRIFTSFLLTGMSWAELQGVRGATNWLDGILVISQGSMLKVNGKEFKTITNGGILQQNLPAKIG